MEREYDFVAKKMITSVPVNNDRTVFKVIEEVSMSFEEYMDIVHPSWRATKSESIVVTDTEEDIIYDPQDEPILI